MKITFPDIFAWTSGVDFANRLSAQFKALKDNGNRSVRDAGTWNSTYNYDTNELATKDGLDYRALVANTNVAPGSDTVTWKVLGGAPSTATAALQTQLQTLNYSGPGPVTLLDVGHGAHSINNSDDLPTIKNTMLAHFGETSSDININVIGSGMAGGLPSSFTLSGGNHPGAYTMQSGTFNGQSTYNTSGGHDYYYFDGTHWGVGHANYGAGFDDTGGTNQSDPTAGWPSNYTFSNVVAGSGGGWMLQLEQTTGLNLPPLRSNTAGASYAVTRYGVQAGLVGSALSDGELSALVNMLRGVGPRLVPQTGHGFNKNAPNRFLVCIGADTYALASRNGNVNVVGEVVDVIDANNFVYQPVGPITSVSYSAVPGTVQYIDANGVASNSKPTTPGLEYTPFGIAINSNEVVLLAQSPRTVPLAFGVPLTASTTLPATARRISLDTTSTGQVLTLPSSATLGAALALEDRELMICNLGSAQWSVACNGSDTFGDGTTTFAINQGDTLRVRPLQRASGTWVNQLQS